MQWKKNKINKENRSQFLELCHLGTMNFVLKYELKWDSRQVKGPLNNWICHKVQFYFYLLVPQKYKTQFQIVRLTWTIKILLTTARVNSVAVNPDDDVLQICLLRRQRNGAPPASLEYKYGGVQILSPAYNFDHNGYHLSDNQNVSFFLKSKFSYRDT